VLAALRQTGPGSALVRELTAAPDLDGLVITERLLADLAPLEGRLWLVVDDVQELGGDALRQLELLIMRAPPELRFVLATRHDVRLGLHREKTMIFHINRMTYKAGLSEEQRDAGLELMRQVGANPAVKSYVVGPELGGEFEYGAVYVVEDLDSYWAYLEFPAHVRLELWGIPYLEKFAAIDVSDSDDPEFGAKIAALQARHQQEHPEIAAEIAQAASFTVPDGSGEPAAAG
jgi:hypothetical protein